MAVLGGKETNTSSKTKIELSVSKQNVNKSIWGHICKGPHILNCDTSTAAMYVSCSSHLHTGI